MRARSETTSPITGMVLIADTDEASARELVGALTERGVVCQIVSTSGETLRAVEERPIDVVILGPALAGDQPLDAVRQARGVQALVMVSAALPLTAWVGPGWAGVGSRF